MKDRFLFTVHYRVNIAYYNSGTIKFFCMKKMLIICISVLLLTANAEAQPERIGAGLTFATKRRFYEGDTGNPGLNIRTWIQLDRKRNFHLAPSATIFNYLVVNHTTHLATTYMFHGDLDLQYMFFHEKTIKLAATAGINYTHIIQKNDLVIASMPDPPTDSTAAGIGPSLGAAMEMRMGPHWDFIVSGRYSFAGLRAGDASKGEGILTAPLSAPIIQVHAVYYFRSRGRGYSRR
jgi:hypothetical protein